MPTRSVQESSDHTFGAGKGGEQREGEGQNGGNQLGPGGKSHLAGNHGAGGLSEGSHQIAGSAGHGASGSNSHGSGRDETYYIDTDVLGSD